MRDLTVALVLFGALAIAAFAGQTPQSGNQPRSRRAAAADAERRPVREQRRPGRRRSFRSPRRPARTATPATSRRRGAVNQGPFDPTTWKYGHGLRSAARLEDLESGQAEDDAAARRSPAARCSAPPIRRPTARWPTPATTSSGPRCSTTIATGKRSRGCGAPARTRRRCPACASPTPTSARSSTRSTPARWSSSCRRSTPSKEAIEARNWTYFPPLGRRSNGGGQAFDAGDVGRRARRLSQHDQRQHRADPDDRDARRAEERRRDREGARRRPRCSRRAATSATSPATARARPTTSARSTSCTTRRSRPAVRLCGPFAWRDRPDFTCFQAGSETAAIARGVAAELGKLANTQGKPEVGPFATTK